jgi:hypothetical protein
MLVAGQRGRLAGRAGNNQRLGALTDMKVDQPGKLGFIDGTIRGHWRSQCDHAACQHAELRSLKGRRWY